MLSEAESIAQDHLSSHLAPLVTLVEQMLSLNERAVDAIADHPRHGAVAKVGLILTSRLANDLRVCSLSAELGYGIQGIAHRRVGILLPTPAGPLGLWRVSVRGGTL